MDLHVKRVLHSQLLTVKNVTRQIFCVIILTATIQSMAQQRLGMLDGNPLWSYYFMEHEIDYERTGYSKHEIEYWDNYHEEDEPAPKLYYKDAEPQFVYCFLYGKEEYKGREYDVLCSLDVNEALEKGFSPALFKKELLVRQEGGRVYADTEMFTELRHANGITLRIWTYFQELDSETIIYDLDVEPGHRWGTDWNFVRRLDDWVGLDGKKRRNYMADSREGDIVEGIGPLKPGYGNPMIAMIENQDMWGMDHHTKGWCLNMYWQYGQQVQQAIDCPQLEEMHDMGACEWKKISFYEPPFLSEMLEVVKQSASASDHIVLPTPSTPSALYDLQGRKLNGKPRRGLYLKDGRKMVAN